MHIREFLHILGAIIIVGITSAFAPSRAQGAEVILPIFVYSVILVVVAVGGKKLAAHLLDAEVEHELWTMHRFGFKKHQYMSQGMPFGVILPLFFSLFTLGLVKLPALLTYEARAATHRAAKRFGFYSYAAMTDWHNALIAALGLFGLWVLAFVAYLTGHEYLVQMSAWYACASLLPFSKLDGTQLFFGSRVLYTLCLLGTLILTVYSFLLAGSF
ncbi:hypothetical protein FJZ22_03170 [Candidatus Pacearchaeota archaeon]|nr:hypothetical protein [Candidatus Pacearchaeota archaeon]